MEWENRRAWTVDCAADAIGAGAEVGLEVGVDLFDGKAPVDGLCGIFLAAIVAAVEGRGDRTDDGTGNGSDIDVDGGDDGVRRSSWYKFFPIAQRSSQLVCPTCKPCVRQSQATSQARKVIASTKLAYIRGSSLARLGRDLDRWRMRGRERGRLESLAVVSVVLWSLCREASGL